MGLRTRNKIKTLGITEVIINRTLKKKVRITKRLGKGAMLKYPIKILLRELLGKKYNYEDTNEDSALKHIKIVGMFLNKLEIIRGIIMEKIKRFP